MCDICGTGGTRRPCRGVAMAHGVARRGGVPVGSSRDRPSIRSLARWRRRQRFAGGASSGRWSWRRHRAGGEAGRDRRGPGEGAGGAPGKGPEGPGAPRPHLAPLFPQAPRSRRGPRAAGVRRAAAGGGRRPRERQNPHGEGGRTHAPQGPCGGLVPVPHTGRPVGGGSPGLPVGVSPRGCPRTAVSPLPQRCWDVALAPLKQIPMNLFIMYMAGNTISIFPAMMVCMMGWRPLQALMSLSASEYGPRLSPDTPAASRPPPAPQPFPQRPPPRVSPATVTPVSAAPTCPAAFAP